MIILYNYWDRLYNTFITITGTFVINNFNNMVKWFHQIQEALNSYKRTV
jgi:hypothetical protein